MGGKRKVCSECGAFHERARGMYGAWCRACRTKASKIQRQEDAAVAKAQAEFDAFSALVRAEAGL